MKINKAQFKSFVKECLVEILSEGIGGFPVNKSVQSSVTFPEKTQNILKQQQLSSAAPKIPTQHLKEAIRREAGGDKMLESVLADTAASTLPKMLQNDGKFSSKPSPTGIVEQVVAASNPEDIFGEDTASKWANLAFMDMSPKMRNK